jgi:hypothetical protein
MEDSHYNDSLRFLVYKDNKVIGYTHSMAEAEAICEKDETLQWERIRPKSEALIRQFAEPMTIHDHS